jgi:hypothetical protein
MLVLRQGKFRKVNLKKALNLHVVKKATHADLQALYDYILDSSGWAGRCPVQSDGVEPDSTCPASRHLPDSHEA